MDVEVVVDPAREVIVWLSNVHKTYLLGIEGVPALRGVSLQIYRGEFVVVYGTSGGGKTSLLNIMGTIDKPTKGELKICNTIINPKTNDKALSELRLSKLGFVFQTFNLIPSLTAIENVELPMKLKGDFPSNVQYQLASDSLIKVGLGHRLDHFPAQLSGGEQQRVTIARAIANKPELLLLDEPTGDLDTFNTLKIIDLLIELNTDKGMTMVMVTHDMYLKNFANRVIWMRDGKVAKIEEVSAKTRTNAIKDLRKKIQALTSTSKQDSSHKDSGIVSTDYSNSETIPGEWSHTEIRQPCNYEPVDFSLQKHTTAHPLLRSNTENQPSQVEIGAKSPASKVTAEMLSPDSGFQSTSTPISSDSTKLLITKPFQ